VQRLTAGMKAHRALLDGFDIGYMRFGPLFVLPLQIGWLGLYPRKKALNWLTNLFT
jgi:hypothetical protein